MEHILTLTTDAGNYYTALQYVEQWPGLRGDYVLRDTCAKCGGSGVIEHSGLNIVFTDAEGRTIHGPGCFDCQGKGFTSRKVSSARATERRRIKRENARRYVAADKAASRAATEAKRAELAAKKAKAEEERRAELVQGFYGPEGERIRDVEVELVSNRRYEAESYSYSGMEQKSVMTFRTVNGGCVLVWFTTARAEKPGETFKLTGTIKDLKVYAGQDQTIINRCILTPTQKENTP